MALTPTFDPNITDYEIDAGSVQTFTITVTKPNNNVHWGQTPDADASFSKEWGYVLYKVNDQEFRRYRLPYDLPESPSVLTWDINIDLANYLAAVVVFYICNGGDVMEFTITITRD